MKDIMKIDTKYMYFNIRLYESKRIKYINIME